MGRSPNRRNSMRRRCYFPSIEKADTNGIFHFHVEIKRLCFPLAPSQNRRLVWPARRLQTLESQRDSILQPSVAAPAATLGCVRPDRKSTRLNSSHLGISYGLFCFKKKKTKGGTGEPGPLGLAPTGRSSSTHPR